VAVYDLGQTEDGTLYIAMELVDGPSLKDVIRQTGPMEPSRIVRLFRQVVTALALAHRHNIVHRDLKPHNIMLTTDSDGAEVAKLLDFGIAKTFDESGPQLTATGFALGTPQYMSPEQAMGKEVDGRSDLYALGIILYEMLIGDVPFSDPSTPAILIKHMTEVPTPPSRRRPDLAVPPQLEAIALRCMEKDPARRFKRAEEIAAELDRTLVAPGVDIGDEKTMLLGFPQAIGTPGSEVVGPTVILPGPAAPPPAGTVILADQQKAPTSTGTPPDAMAGRATAESSQPTRGTLAASPAGEAGIAGAVVPASAPAAADKPVTHPTVKAASPPTETPVVASGRSLTPIVLVAVVLVVLVAGAAAVAFHFGLIGFSSKVSESDLAAAVPGEAPLAAPATAAYETTPANEPAAAGEVETAAAGTPEAGPASQPADSKVFVAPPAGVAATPDVRAPAAAAATGSPAAKVPGAAVAPKTTPDPAPQRLQPTAPPASPEVAPEKPAPTQALPANPQVFFQCVGAAEVCGTLRSTVGSAFEKAGLPMTRTQGQADVVVQAEVSLVEERFDQQFGTTFAVRTYSIDVEAEAPRLGVVSMPPPRTLSFDARFGQQRVLETSRVVADTIVERVRSFWSKQ
jgi:eukaryotic-like serine/threonine-protein kinase